MWWASELLSSVKFLAVTGERSFFRSKRVYEFALPGALTLFCLIFYLTFPAAFEGSFLKNFTSGIFQFMIFVVPFHLAALAAFATYQSNTLDETLEGVNAQLRVWSNQDNGYFYKDLTLRQYASLLFGYLCSVGVLFLLVYLFVSNLQMDRLLGRYFQIAYDVALAIGIFFLFHYVTLTIYAITFLFDKVNKVRSV